MIISDNLVKWLASGRRGVSSNTIATHLTGIDCMHGSGKSHPHDPADLDRCRMLLEAVPELDLEGMCSLSPVWQKLVEKWSELCASMDFEAPRWRDGIGSAPITYRMMRDFIELGERES